MVRITQCLHLPEVVAGQDCLSALEDLELEVLLLVVTLDDITELVSAEALVLQHEGVVGVPAREVVEPLV